MSEQFPARMRVTAAAQPAAALKRQAVKLVRLEMPDGTPFPVGGGLSIPAPPADAGVYKLQATVAEGGAVTYAWVIDAG